MFLFRYKDARRTNTMGKLNVTPRGISSGKSSGHFSHPSFTTSLIQPPIQLNRSFAWLFFNCSSIGQDFSKCLMTLGSVPFCKDPLGVVVDLVVVLCEDSSSIKPTLRFVPPLG